jgi:hypothetical protein
MPLSERLKPRADQTQTASAASTSSSSVLMTDVPLLVDSKDTKEVDGVKKIVICLTCSRTLKQTEFKVLGSLFSVVFVQDFLPFSCAQLDATVVVVQLKNSSEVEWLAKNQKFIRSQCKLVLLAARGESKEEVRYDDFRPDAFMKKLPRDVVSREQYMDSLVDRIPRISSRAWNKFKKYFKCFLE